ncbi:MAG: DUF4230 domain-containing protein [Actinobacteria bacterium]|nr:MAG: DUF4230 domain-containing protein [Actinomycetota bacterium]
MTMTDKRSDERETVVLEPTSQDQAPLYYPQPQRQTGSKVLIGLAGFFLAVLLAVVAFVAYSARGIVEAIPTPADIAAVFEPEPFSDVGPVVVSSVQDLGSLTTVEVVEHTVVEQGTDAGWLSWARGDSLRMIAVARIGAGVDITGLTPSDFSVSEEGVVEVTLPRAEIQYVAVDNDATEVLDRDMGLFTKGDPQLESEARRVAETVLVEAAVEDGLLTNAEENATVVLRNFLISLGYTDVIVNFE